MNSEKDALMMARQNKLFSPIPLIGLAVLILAVDYLTGPIIRFPIMFLLPIALASWYSSRQLGLGLSIMMSLVRAYFEWAFWEGPGTILEIGINALIQIMVMAAFAVVINRVSRQRLELEKTVKHLEGILPICSFCKKIRNKNNDWVRLEEYIMRNSEAKFSHGFCPECGARHYADFIKPEP